MRDKDDNWLQDEIEAERKEIIKERGYSALDRLLLFNNTTSAEKKYIKNDEPEKGVFSKVLSSLSPGEKENKPNNDYTYEEKKPRGIIAFTTGYFLFGWVAFIFGWWIFSGLVLFILRLISSVVMIPIVYSALTFLIINRIWINLFSLIIWVGIFYSLKKKWKSWYEEGKSVNR